jgi:hypothetical protein
MGKAGAYAKSLCSAHDGQGWGGGRGGGEGGGEGAGVERAQRRLPKI